MSKCCYVYFDVKDFGATGRDSVDDTAAIQAALNVAHAAGGGIVCFSPGVYLVQRPAGVLAGALDVPSNVSLAGTNSETCVIKLMPRQPEGTRVLVLDKVENVRIADLTIDGNDAEQVQSYNKQMHCIWVSGSRHVIIERVHCRQAHGDGIVLQGNAEGDQPKPVADCLVTKCLFSAHARNGVSLGCHYPDPERLVRGTGFQNISIVASTFRGDISAQQIDFEPALGFGDTFENVIISHNHLEMFTGNDQYGLAVSGRQRLDRELSGSEPDDMEREGFPVRSVIVSENLIDNPVLIRWAKNVVMHANVVTANSPTHAAVRIDRSSHVTFSNNHITLTNLAASGTEGFPASAVLVLHGQTKHDDRMTRFMLVPQNIMITGNFIKSTCCGVALSSASECRIEQNRIENTRPGDESCGADESGIYHHAVLAHSQRCAIRNNIIFHFDRGIYLNHDSEHQHQELCVAANQISAVNIGIAFPSAEDNFLRKATMALNVLSEDTPIKIADNPNTYLVGGNWGERGIYSGKGEPPGVAPGQETISDEVGAMYLRRDGGDSATLYVKESGDRWAPK